MKNNPFATNLLACAIAGGCSLPVQAADFYFGSDQGTQVQVNSELSIGASWRTENADNSLIGYENGGTGATGISDDGNLNFDKGEAFSQILKGSHDVQMTTGNFGSFTRFKYWSDIELENGNRPHGNSVNGYEEGTPLDDSGFTDNAKFSGISLLDAYVYGSFDIAEMALDVRLGRQVLSWGESTFIHGGINSTNPYDLSALRRAGATLEEAILPVGMAYLNFGATDNLSIEAFYQYEWARTELDGCGTFFGSDSGAPGCDYVTLGSVNGSTDAVALDSGLVVNRHDDVEAKDEGQFGIAARYYAEELNNTEFGVYFMNLHSRLPYLSIVRNSNPGVEGVLPATEAGTAAAVPFIPSSTPGLGALSEYNAQYLFEFPEDQKYIGLSFATNVDGVALSGEVSYRPDSPVKINGTHVSVSANTEAEIDEETGIALPFTERVIAAEPGTLVHGYDLYDISQIQVTAIKFVERVMGASHLSLVGEAGLIIANGIEDSDFVYGRDTVFGLGDASTGDGYATDQSWGYRAQAALEYPSAFAGVTLKPSLSWSHDVEGYSPDPSEQFSEGRQSLGLSIEASYQQMYSANLAYQMFDGGDYSTISDKDFVSLSLGVSY